MWDVLFYDETQQRGYRIKVKRLSVGDGVALDSLQDEIANREDLEGRELVSFANNYPLLRYGTATAETAILMTPPEQDDQGNLEFLEDGVEWQTFDLTEAAFWTLDESLFYLWLDAVVKRNPHRDPTLDLLKKSVIAAWQARLNGEPSNVSESVDVA